MSVAHTTPAQSPGTLGRMLRALAAGQAILAGALLCAMALMSVVSIALRAVGLQPVLGDFELMQVGLAVCVSLLLPWCELEGGNIIVDFFTAPLRKAWQRRLDALGHTLFALVIALVAWRTGAGAVSMKSAGETTMLLGFPLWIAYAGMVPGFASTSLCALWCASSFWRQSRDD
jgi:TRAP-type C4-dicarboxylate transport system permease small subunit